MYSVCGLIVPQEDLPFNDLGICPDVVSDQLVSFHCCYARLLLLLCSGIMFMHCCRVTTSLKNLENSVIGWEEVRNFTKIQ